MPPSATSTSGNSGNSCWHPFASYPYSAILAPLRILPFSKLFHCQTLSSFASSYLVRDPINNRRIIQAEKVAATSDHHSTIMFTHSLMCCRRRCFQHLVPKLGGLASFLQSGNSIRAVFHSWEFIFSVNFDFTVNITKSIQVVCKIN